MSSYLLNNKGGSGVGGGTIGNLDMLISPWLNYTYITIDGSGNFTSEYFTLNQGQETIRGCYRIYQLYNRCMIYAKENCKVYVKDNTRDGEYQFAEGDLISDRNAQAIHLTLITL